MKILVTGGSGFIGTYLITDLLKDSHEVLIYDKQKSETYPDYCIIADVRDKEKLTSSLRGFDAVYHLAAEHRDDVRPISLYYDVNVGGAENLVYALETNSVKKLIFTSTVALYGLNAGKPNEDSPLKPFNDYGKSKYKAEAVFKDWANASSSRSLVIVRPTVVFGEKNRGNVYNLLSQIAFGRFIMVGSGKNKKSIAYVRNISKFLTILLQNTPGIHFYNYVDKPDISMEELIRIVFNSLNKDNSSIVRIPYVVGLIGGYVFDFLAAISGRTFPISSIRIKKFCAETVISAKKLEEINFKAPFSIVDGLNRMIYSEFKNDSDQNTF